jgi:hypothetical protein
MYFFNFVDYELCPAHIRLFAVSLYIVMRAGYCCVVWCKCVTFSTEFVVLIPKCQNVIADYVKLSFLFECQIVTLKSHKVFFD